MKNFNFKGVILFTVLTGLVMLSVCDVVLSADYPTKPIELVIPWPAGGRTDIGTRIIAPYLEKYIGTPVVVINKVGGGGIIGMNYIRDAKPDGYTICSGGQALSYFQYQKAESPSLWDYTWIARTYWTPMVVAVNVKSPFHTIKDLVEFARANPGKLRHGNTATGSTTHIASEKFSKEFKIKFTQVPYKGEGDSVKGIGTGEVDLAFGLYVAFRPLVEGGQLRILGVAAEKRDPLYPQIPSFQEQGYEHVEPTWEAIHTPKNLPKNVYDKLFEACRRAITDPEAIEKFGKIGLSMSYQPGPEFTEWLKGWDKEVKEMIYELGLQIKK